MTGLLATVLLLATAQPAELLPKTGAARASGKATTVTPPNVLFIVGDDVGYNDFGFFVGIPTRRSPGTRIPVLLMLNPCSFLDAFSHRLPTVRLTCSCFLAVALARCRTTRRPSPRRSMVR